MGFMSEISEDYERGRHMEDSGRNHCHDSLNCETCTRMRVDGARLQGKEPDFDDIRFLKIRGW